MDTGMFVRHMTADKPKPRPETISEARWNAMLAQYAIHEKEWTLREERLDAAYAEWDRLTGGAMF